MNLSMKLPDMGKFKKDIEKKFVLEIEQRIKKAEQLICSTHKKKPTISVSSKAGKPIVSVNACCMEFEKKIDLILSNKK